MLGSIPAHVVTKLAKNDPTGSIQWETRLAEAFNEYRRSGSVTQDIEAEEKEPVIEAAPPTAPSEEFDAESLALEAFGLINEARVENGMQEVELDEEAMELAKMRAPELEERYDHTRPDGTRMSQTYRCGEIINRRASTPQIAVESWLDSPAHREIILAERYHSAGSPAGRARTASPTGVCSSTNNHKPTISLPGPRKGTHFLFHTEREL